MTTTHTLGPTPTPILTLTLVGLVAGALLGCGRDEGTTPPSGGTGGTGGAGGVTASPSQTSPTTAPIPGAAPAAGATTGAAPGSGGGSAAGAGSPAGTGSASASTDAAAGSGTLAAPASATAGPAPTPPSPVPPGVTSPPPAADVAANRAGPAATGGAAPGLAVYTQTCAVCHAAGVAGAPRLGDKVDWGTRLAQGQDTLYRHAIEGYQGRRGVMPPKGGNPALTDAQVRAAVDYMVSR